MQRFKQFLTSWPVALISLLLSLWGVFGAAVKGYFAWSGLLDMSIFPVVISHLTVAIVTAHILAVMFRHGEPYRSWFRSFKRFFGIEKASQLLSWKTIMMIMLLPFVLVVSQRKDLILALREAEYRLFGVPVEGQVGLGGPFDLEPPKPLVCPGSPWRFSYMCA